MFRRGVGVNDYKFQFWQIHKQGKKTVLLIGKKDFCHSKCKRCFYDQNAICKTLFLFDCWLCWIFFAVESPCHFRLFVNHVICYEKNVVKTSPVTSPITKNHLCFHVFLLIFTGDFIASGNITWTFADAFGCIGSKFVGRSADSQCSEGLCWLP